MEFSSAKNFQKTTLSYIKLNKENNFISYETKQKKLRDGFLTHFKIATKHGK